MIWKIANIDNKLFKDFYNYIEACEYIILDIENTKYKENNCHNNVNKFINEKGNKYGKILGYYVLMSKNNDEILAIQHSVNINLETEEIFDITPCSIYNKRLFIYGYKMKEYASIQYTDNKINTIKTEVNNIDGYFL